MPVKKAKKAPKPKKKLLSAIDEEDEELAEKRAEEAADDEVPVEREPGIEEIAKMTADVAAATDADLDDLDLPTEVDPQESEN